MKKLLISSIVGLGLLGLPAFAADMAVKMPVKAPPPAPAPGFNWTGFYVGGDIARDPADDQPDQRRR